MGVNLAAQQAEIKAFKAVQSKLGNPTAFASPAGFETAFPDFGFSVNINKKRVDLHFEYKADAKAQMGSMRDWVFDGSKFTTSGRVTDKDEMEAKMSLLELMNGSQLAITNGKRLLTDLQKYADPSIKQLFSGSMNFERDMKKRWAKLNNFAANTDNYQVANIDNSEIGNMIIRHYKKKFKENLKAGANYSMLLMMLGDEVWFVDETGNLTYDEKQQLLRVLGAQRIPVLSNLRAKLEVRIQPRGLSSPDKRASIDVMASYRLSGKPTPGYKII